MDIFNREKVKKLEKELAEHRENRIEAQSKVHMFYLYMKALREVGDDRTREVVSELLKFQENEPWFRKHIMMIDD